MMLLIFVFLIKNNSTDKTLSVNLCKKVRPNFAEIFGEKWENEIIGENENQNDQNELTDQIDLLDVQQKREIIHKFHAIKEGIKKMGKYSSKNRNKTEQKIAKKLGINRKKIYEWKKEFGINKKNSYQMKKREFVERIKEFKRMSKNGKQKQFADELGIDKKTFIKWKRELGIEIGKSPIRFSDEQKRSKMNDYYKMKKANPSLTDKKIAGILKIGRTTLVIWKNENNY